MIDFTGPMVDRAMDAMVEAMELAPDPDGTDPARSVEVQRLGRFLEAAAVSGPSGMRILGGQSGTALLVCLSRLLPRLRVAVAAREPAHPLLEQLDHLTTELELATVDRIAEGL